MHSGTMSEVSAYLQPDLFDSDKKKNDFLDQNPLLLLARTCQNIGLETKSASSSSASSSSSSSANGNNSVKVCNSLLVSNSFAKTPSNRAAAAAKTSIAMIPSVQSLVFVNGAMLHSPKGTQSLVAPVPPPPPPPPPPSLSTTPSEESGLYIPPSSNSLVQLARLSSSLQIPSVAVNERQKRSSKSNDASKFASSLSRPSGASTRPAKRARRQSFGRTVSSFSSTSKPLDFSSHFSSHSSPLSVSSSVSPSSLRSTPPSQITPPPAPQQPGNSTSFEFMKNLAGLPLPTDTSTTANAAPLASNTLETFFNVGSILGASPESLRKLLILIVHTLSELRSAESHLVEQQLKQQQSKVSHGSISDPSTQCLYCGHVCSDMGSLVQHIYIHLASLHKQHTETPPLAQTVAIPPPPSPPAPMVPSVSTSHFDLASFYTKLLQKSSESYPTAPPSMITTDPNSLFLAWLNVFRPAYSEGLSRGANR